MLYSSQEEAVADSYFSFANDVAGILAISLAATALQFEHPQPFANFFLLIVVIWVLSKRHEYAKVAKSYAARFNGFIGYMRLFWKIKIFFIGIACLAYVGAGLLTKDLIYKVAGF
jgi:uncharacterized membrane protein